ncbi:PKHG3 protein, partial [Crypturellus undulatus]|nr:PKHG3 protein [Crypturellus undulatus]
MEEAGEELPGDGPTPWVGGLHNRNNNASPAGRLGPRNGRPFSPFGARPPGGEPSYVERVVLELVESERTYARDLRSIVEGYLGKIIDAEEPLLRPEQVSALFGNIEDIYELSSNLLQNLDSCNNDPVAVAVCFVTRSQEFDIYTQYCNNYPNSVAALTECMRSKQQAKFFRECQEQMRHALPLGAYLLKPVQRILKYHLLLQEIAKHFEHKSGDDYDVVVEAIDTMTCVAWYINDMKRKHEHAIRQQEIQSLLLNWKGPDLTTYGELVLEGTFRVHRVRNERAFFLFDKALLITKRRGDHYVYKNHIPCSSLMLIESTRDSLCFSVAHYKHIKQQYSLQAKNVEEKRMWTHHIKRLILENHHAIIPQKAKEAILDMDLFRKYRPCAARPSLPAVAPQCHPVCPTDPPRLPRCSPERLKKSWSCQPLEESPMEPRHGRRQSAREPSWRQRSPRSALGPGLRHRELWRKRRRRRKRLSAQTARRRCPVPRLWAPRRSSDEELEMPVGVAERPEEPSSSDVESVGISEATLAGRHEPEPEPCLDEHVTEPAEDLRTLSSEEEEEEEEEEGALHGPGSILPPSVLDQASVIAERFGSS